MTPDTAAALQRINRDFYHRHASVFSATRERAWPAWDRVAAMVAGRRAGGKLSVLDLGCGNGRLLRFLEGRWGGLDYLGVDASEPMLEIARAMSSGGQFLRRDLVRDGLPLELPGEPFDLIAVFGLLHHIPGFDNRAALLRAAARQLASRGMLAVAFWQFGAVNRFRRRMVSWKEYNQTAAVPIDPRSVEEGDTLLAWGEAAATVETPWVRYCHWTTPAEAERLLAGLGLDTVASFRADGRGGDLNLYRVLSGACG